MLCGERLRRGVWGSAGRSQSRRCLLRRRISGAVAGRRACSRGGKTAQNEQSDDQLLAYSGEGDSGPRNTSQLPPVPLRVTR